MNKSKIVKATLIEVALPLKEPFVTGFGTLKDRNTLLVKLETESGLIGWGEAALLQDPIYLEEWIHGGWQFITQYLLPMVVGTEMRSREFYEKTQYLRRNNIAKFGVETALHSLEVQEKKSSYQAHLGGASSFVRTGASIGMRKTVQETVAAVDEAVEQGLTRIKLKIHPGWDYEPVKAVRERYPDILLMVDANSSYTLNQAKDLQKLDEFNLLMIEQPLAYDDIIDHAVLAKKLTTPICLDESICSSEDARKALQIGACSIINVKPARVGSLFEVQRINELAKQFHAQLWCGGMLESDIGKVANLAAATLSQFQLPADISDWREHFTSTFSNLEAIYSQGVYTLGDDFGRSLKIDEEWLHGHTVRTVSLPE